MTDNELDPQKGNERERERRIREDNEAIKKALGEVHGETTDVRRAKMKKEEEELFAADIPARFVKGEGYVDAAIQLTIENKQVITLEEAYKLLRSRFNNGN